MRFSRDIYAGLIWRGGTIKSGGKNRVEVRI
jgi:hypothetical protein